MSRKRIVEIITLVLCGFVLYCFNVNGAKSFRQILTDGSILENIYYITQIMVCVTAIIGAIIAVWQYVLSVRTENVNIRNKRIEKAIELSEYYKDNILNRLTALRYIFEISGVKSELDKINTSKMKAFDSNELNDILDKRTKNEIYNLIYSKDMVKTIVKAAEIYAINIEVNDDKAKSDDVDEKTVRHVVSCVVNDLLNNMEYFAMFFTHGVADGTVVYQSLHQTYIECVQLLYYNIAINNRPDGEQLYTNVTTLYNDWNKIAEQKTKEHEKSGRKVIGGNKVETLQ